MRPCRVAALLLALPITAEAQSPTPDAWREDLEVLVRTLESEHADLYHTASQAEFRASIDALAARLEELDGNTIIAQLAQAVATLGDGHTLVNVLWDRSLPFRRLPTGFARAADGLVILEAEPGRTELLGGRVLRLGRMDAEDALATMRPLFSSDNHWTSLQAVDLLRVPELLQATGISPSSDRVELVVETRDGETRSVELAAVDRASLSTPALCCGPGVVPLWLRNRDDPYWLERLPEHEALYVQFNGADRDKQEESLAAFGRRMERLVREHDIKRLVIDLRWNSGGSRWRARHLLNAVIRVEGHLGTERATRERRPSGRLFAIIGPRTFSAATQFALDLDLHTNVLFVGEPTGGKPNHFGEVGRTRLPNSRLEVRFSRLYHQASHPLDDRPAILPDIPVLPSIDDYRAGRDAALERVWEHGAADGEEGSS